MVIAIVGAGGKTTLLHRLAAQYRSQGQRVFVTTTTHIYIEPDALCTDDADAIIARLHETGYALAGLPVGEKLHALSPETYRAVCRHADTVLVEADGSRHLPLKYPAAHEPVIPDNADRIIVVCGLHSLGRRAREVCHRYALAQERLGLDPEAVITPGHIAALVQNGYLAPLRSRFPGIRVIPWPSHDGSPEQTAIARQLLEIWRNSGIGTIPFPHSGV